MKKLPIMLTLAGGLGNQLFQIAAGIFIEKKLLREVVYNISNLKYKVTSQPGNYTRMLEIGELISNNEIINSRFPARFDLPIRYIRRLKDPSCVLIERDPNTDILGQISDRTTAIYGYFQSAQLIESVWDSIKIELGKSERFKNLVNPTKKERIAIHLRFGDYSDDAKTRATHGLTSLTYFEEATNLFNSKNTKLSDILVITDDVQKANKFIGKSFTEMNVNFLSSRNPLQDLEEFAKSSHVVINNSTFSWWGAWFAYKSHQSQIIYPRPWFADEKDPMLPIYNENWRNLRRNYST